MDIGIYDLNMCSNLTYKERLMVYKNEGFEKLGLYIDDAYMSNGEKYEDIINYAKQIGMMVNQVHVDYKISNDICDNLQSYISYVKSRLDICEKYKIKNMVLHASKGDNPPLVNEAAVNAIVELAKDFSEINLCFENVRNNSNLSKLLAVDCDNICMCYDMGHENCYSQEDLIKLYANKIKCAHLHNNRGQDSHNLISDGDIDYKNKISKLKDIKDCDMCLEVFPPKGAVLTKSEFITFVKKAMAEIKDL